MINLWIYCYRFVSHNLFVHNFTLNSKMKYTPHFKEFEAKDDSIYFSNQQPNILIMLNPHSSVNSSAISGYSLIFFARIVTHCQFIFGLILFENL